MCPVTARGQNPGLIVAMTVVFKVSTLSESDRPFRMRPNGKVRKKTGIDRDKRRSTTDS